MRRRIFPICFVAVLVFFWSAAAIALPPVSRTVLQNGLVLLTSEEQSLPFVTFHLLLKSGSKDDPVGREGVAEMTASCLTFGTAKRSMVKINEELDFMGASIGASASKDFIDVSMVVMKKDLEKALPIFMDVLIRPAFPAVEVKKEVSRLLGAIQSSEDQPTVVAERAFDTALYGNGPYGHPTEGTKSSVSKLTRNHLAAFHRAYFHPNNAILVIVGAIDEATLRGSILPALGGWARKPLPSARASEQTGERRQTIDIARPVTQSSIVMGNGGMSRENPDYYAALVMNYILGGGSLSSRLMEAIRIKKGLAYSVESFFDARKLPGSFQVNLQTKAASTDEAIRAVHEEIARIRTEPVSDRELEDAKKYLVGSFPQKFSSQSRIAAFFGQVEYYGLGLDYPDRYPGLINSVTREDALRVARAYLHPDAFITVVVTDHQARKTGAGQEAGR